MITLTEENIEYLKTPSGGFNKATADVLGVMWPLQAGWKQHLVGVRIGDRRWDKAVKAAREGPARRFRGNTRRARR